MDAKLRNLIKKEHDDDSIDRTIYATTVYILGFFAILIIAKQYVGDPLQCWVPAEYIAAWESYIEKYCFVENTYYVNKTIPTSHAERKQYELRYYQWIPYLLWVQALLCYAPKLIFKLMYSFSDLRVTDLVQLAYRESKQKFEKQTQIGATIATKLLTRHGVKVRLHFDWYLTSIYLLMKVLFVVALIIQILIMNFFVASSTIFWGLDILMVYLHNFMSYQRTRLAHYWTLSSCNILINMFAEKIYVFLWLWIYTLLIVMILNLFAWMYRTLSMGSKIRMVRDALRLHHTNPSDSEIRKFIEKFLRLDGVLVLRLIDSNAGYVHMADILYELWKNYGTNHLQEFEIDGNNKKVPL
ncbi:Innexin family-containing protein [Aphelenchoides bicaudatus]|nr:Innexin family-containing protein [Aphelenchoides bicaudatus]